MYMYIMHWFPCIISYLYKIKLNGKFLSSTSKGCFTGLVHGITIYSTQYYNVQYTEGVACGYHKVEHLRLRI